MKKRVSLIVEIIVVVVCFLFLQHVYFQSPVRDRADHRYSLHVADSILREGDVDLDEYSDLIDREANYKRTIQIINGHIYPLYPLGSSIFVAPLLGFYEYRAKMTEPPYRADKLLVVQKTDQLDALFASFITTGTIFFIYLTSRLFLPFPLAFGPAFVIAFGTSMWSTTGNTLWQHTISAFILSVSLFVLTTSQKKAKLLPLVAIPLAFSYITRPTNILSLAIISLYVLFKLRTRIWKYVVLLSIVLIPFFIVNYRYYGDFLSPYYKGNLVVAHQTFAVGPKYFSASALMAHLISPNRGLLIYSPVLVFALVGIFIKIKKRQFNTLDAVLISILFIHWFILASYSGWWGGWAYGPRLFTDILPYFAYFLVPVFAKFYRIWPRISSGTIFMGAVFVYTLLVSILIHYHGSHEINTFYWNGHPMDIDYHLERVWDWNDLQLLRGEGWEREVLRRLYLPFPQKFSDI